MDTQQADDSAPSYDLQNPLGAAQEQQLGQNAPWPPPFGRQLPQPQQQAPPPQQPPPPPPMPWSPQDDAEMARYQQTIRNANSDLVGGKITPQIHQQTVGQIAPLLGGLQQRQAAFQKQAQQAAKAQAMDQSALTQSIANVHLQVASQALPKLATHVVDPVTGDAETFIPEIDQHGAVKWQPVKYDGARAREKNLQSSQEAASASPASFEVPRAAPGILGAGEAVNRMAAPQEQPAGGFGPGALGLARAMLTGAVPAQAAERVTPEAGRDVETLQDVAARVTQPQQQGPRILNAAGEDITQQQQEQYDRWKRTGSWEAEQPSTGNELSQGMLRQFQERAERATPQVHPQSPEWMHLHRMDSVNKKVQAQIDNFHRLNQHRLDSEAATKRGQELANLRHELEMKEIKEKAEQQRLKTQKEHQELTLGQQKELIGKHEDRMAKEIAANLEEPGKKPKWHTDVESHDEELRRRVNRDLGMLGLEPLGGAGGQDRGRIKVSAAPVEEKIEPIKPKEPAREPARDLASQVGDVVQHPLQSAGNALSAGARGVGAALNEVANPDTSGWHSGMPFSQEVGALPARGFTAGETARMADLAKRMTLAMRHQGAVESIRGFGPALEDMWGLLETARKENRGLNTAEMYRYTRRLKQFEALYGKEVPQLLPPLPKQ